MYEQYLCKIISHAGLLFVPINSHRSLAGDGQIDIDSDEAIIAAEREMYEMRKAKKAKTSGGGSGGSSIQPTDTFIGVNFDGVGHVKRIHVSEG